MNIRIEVERLVVHDLPIAQADRRRLLAAVESAITERLTAQHPQWDSAAVPVVTAAPITLSGTGIGPLADGIASAATQAIGRSGRGRP